MSVPPPDAAPASGDGQLVVVATPIGNLGDVAPRAVDVLARADHVCCEDTRRTRALLSAMGVAAGRRLVSLNAHNERERIERVLSWLGQGRTVALVTDAGTPAVSDPGALLISAAASAGITVTAIPGPSAALAALTVSGLPTARFCVEGFLPRRGRARRERLEELAVERRTVVLFEAPTRLAVTLEDLAALDPRRSVVVARELTKLYEEVWRGTAGLAVEAFSDGTVKGEVVIVLAGATQLPAADEAELDSELDSEIGRLLSEGLSTSRVAATAAARLGVTKRRAYERALTLKRTGPHPQATDEGRGERDRA